MLPSTVSASAAPDARLWFQLYYWEDRSLSHAVVDKARDLGCEALFIPFAGERAGYLLTSGGRDTIG